MITVVIIRIVYTYMMGRRSKPITLLTGSLHILILFNVKNT